MDGLCKHGNGPGCELCAAEGREHDAAMAEDQRTRDIALAAYAAWQGKSIEHAREEFDGAPDTDRIKRKWLDVARAAMAAMERKT